MTGNNTAVVAAYEACSKIRDPKDCVKAGKVMNFTIYAPATCKQRPRAQKPRKTWGPCID